MRRFVNNWSTQLQAPLLASDSVVQLPPALVARLAASLSPGDHIDLTIDPQGAAPEILRITAAEVDAATISLRGLEGTAAPGVWPAGTVVRCTVTAAIMESLQEVGPGLELSDDAPSALAGAAAAGSSPMASRADHAHQLPTPAAIGAASSADLAAGLGGKVDTLAGYGLSQENYTPAEKSKLAGLEGSHYRGTFINLTALQSGVASPGAGDYADVDGGAGAPVLRYIRDVNDAEWVAQAGSADPVTAAQVKTLYESNPDTNAFTDAEQAKLAGVAAGATANANTDSLAEGATNLYHTEARVRGTVLAGLSLASTAVVAASDTLLQAIGKLAGRLALAFDRANHTGTQATSTITGLDTALAAKLTNPMTAAGDLIVGGASGAPQRLAPGADGKVVKMVSGAPAWADEAGGGGVAPPVVRAIAANETLGLSSINTFGFNSTASNYTSTIPAQGTVAWTADAEMHFKASSTGTVTITAAAGVTLNGVVAGSLTLYAGAAGSIKRKAADVWEAVGQFGTTAQQQAALGLNGASLEWTTYGGTANAITLTPLVARSAYVAGDKVRFRATATNTGATTISLSGLGVKTCVTVTGAALPAGYIRTGVDTEAVYDGTNFVVRRALENGSNANGSYTRWEDGTQVCTMSMSVSADITLAFLGGFRSSGFSWVYPAGFVAAPVTTGTSDALTGFGVGYGTKTTTSVFLFWFAVTSQAAATREASLKATGRWYA